MLCDDCKKNQACIRLTQVSNVNASKIDKHLCEECAKKYGDFIFNVNQNFSVNDFSASSRSLKRSFSTLFFPSIFKGMPPTVSVLRLGGNFAETGVVSPASGVMPMIIKESRNVKPTCN